MKAKPGRYKVLGKNGIKKQRDVLDMDTAQQQQHVVSA